ncbi:hypothetical protein ACUHMQ_20685 [Chitinimonas sp. PSY-7]|uniref:hypothetical protein n=1 Tax=Chitinimonas sp. PSY-7 TaxID=3459088 RepID=UPI0040401E7E
MQIGLTRVEYALECWADCGFVVLRTYAAVPPAIKGTVRLERFGKSVSDFSLASPRIE